MNVFEILEKQTRAILGRRHKQRNGEWNTFKITQEGTGVFAVRNEDAAAHGVEIE
jgi:hypothetical protein